MIIDFIRSFLILWKNEVVFYLVKQYFALCSYSVIYLSINHRQNRCRLTFKACEKAKALVPNNMFYFKIVSRNVVY